MQGLSETKSIITTEDEGLRQSYCEEDGNNNASIVSISFEEEEADRKEHTPSHLSEHRKKGRFFVSLPQFLGANEAYVTLDSPHGGISQPFPSSCARCWGRPSCRRLAFGAITIQGDLDCEDFKSFSENWIKVGNGAQRDVYKTEYNGQPIVVKKTKSEYVRLNPDFKKKVGREAVALSLARNVSSKVVHLVGECHGQIATEWLEIDMQAVFDLPTGASQFSDNQLLLVAQDMAEGMADLHDRLPSTFVINDVKPSQWMMSAGGVVKMGDLNGGRFLKQTQLGEECPFLHPRARTLQKRVAQDGVLGFPPGKPYGMWASPEMLFELPLTEKADVFSLALSLWALAAGQRPDAPVPAGRRHHGSPAAWVAAGGGFPLPGAWPAALREALRRGLAANPDARASAREVADLLAAEVARRGLAAADRWLPPRG